MARSGGCGRSSLQLLAATLLCTVGQWTAAQTVSYPIGFLNVALLTADTKGNVNIYVCTVNDPASVALTFHQASYDKMQAITTTTRLEQTIPHGDVVIAKKTYPPDPIEPVEDRGVLVTSNTGDAVVYAVQSSPNKIDATRVTPATTDSVAFYIAGLKGISAAPQSGIIVVAVESGTSVTVRNKDNTVAAMFTLTGPRFIAQILRNQMDTTGMHVTSTKPVNVFSTVACGTPGTIEQCELLMEQIPPVAELGKTYIVPPIDGRESGAGYIFRVVASAASTTVTTTSAATLTPTGPTNLAAAGDHVEIKAADAAVPVQIDCSNPCLVMQFNLGAQAEPMNTAATTMAPFMMTTTPVERMGSASCFVTGKVAIENAGVVSEEDLENYISIVTLTANINDIRLDGAALMNPSWKAQGSYSATMMPLPAGWHSLTVTGSTATFAAYVYGKRMSSKSPSLQYAYGYSVGLAYPTPPAPTTASTTQATSTTQAATTAAGQTTTATTRAAEIQTESPTTTTTTVSTPLDLTQWVVVIVTSIAAAGILLVILVMFSLT